MLIILVMPEQANFALASEKIDKGLEFPLVQSKFHLPSVVNPVKLIICIIIMIVY